MADNRDPRKKSRTNRNRRTSSSNRAARSRASAADTPRPTSSQTRSSRTSGRAVVTQSGAQGQRRGAQGPRNPPVQGPSRRTPNAVAGDTGRRGGTNRYGTKQPTGPKSNVPRPQARGDKLPSSSGARRVARAAARGAGVAGGAGLLPSLARAGLMILGEGAVRPFGDGTLKGKEKVSRPNNQKPKVKPKPAPKPKATSSAAKDFDRAFAAARKAGKSTFTWRGKKYNTKLK